MRALLLAFFLITCIQVFASERIEVSEKLELVELSNQTYRYTDTTASLTIAQMVNLSNDQWNKTNVNGFTPHAEWSHVFFENNTKKGFKKVLYLNNIFTYEADFYFVVNGKLEQDFIATGLSRPKDSKLYLDTMYPVEVDFPPNSQVDVYLRVYNPMSTTNTPLFLMSFDEAMKLKNQRISFSFMWAGILFLSLLLSLFLYLNIRQAIFLNYVFLAIGTFMFCSANLGAMFLFVDSDPNQFSLDYLQIGAVLVLNFMPRFLNRIVPIATISPIAWSGMKIVGYIGAVTATLYLIPFFKYSFHYTVLTANILTALTAINFLYLLVILFIAALRKKERAISLFTVYLIYLGLAFGAVLMPLFGADNNGLNTFYLILGGSIFETIAFMLLMAQVTLAVYRDRGKLNMQLQHNQEIMMNAIVKGQEDERKRFAQDLHDGFGQMISCLNLNLSSLEDIKSTETERRIGIFESSSSILEDMYVELKNICFNLMPHTLISAGVGEALIEFANRINITQKVIIHVSLFGIENRLKQVQEISIYRISQEWINNILKYSDATKINLQITKDEEEITLLIEDNGIGFDMNLLLIGKGNGWKNIASRANLIKGEVELDTVEGKKGTTFILNAPADIGVKENKVVELLT